MEFGLFCNKISLICFVPDYNIIFQLIHLQYPFSTLKMHCLVAQYIQIVISTNNDGLLIIHSFFFKYVRTAF